MNDFKIKNINDRKTIKIPEEPVSYSLPDMFGLSCNNVDKKILILSSGLPIHNDLNKFSDFENFCDSGKNPEDKTGQSVLIAAAIQGSKSDSVMGFYEKSDLYFAKVVSDDGEVLISSVIAGVLWGIIKKVDIIVIPFVIEQYDEVLNDTLKKADDNGILIVGTYSRTKSGHNSYENIIRFKYEEGKGIEWEIKRLKTSICVSSPKKYEPFSLFFGSHFARLSDEEASVVMGLALIVYTIDNCKNRNMTINYKNVNELIVKT